MGGVARTGHEVVVILSQLRDRQVALDPAALVEELGVGHLTRSLGHISCADPGESRAGARTAQAILGKGGLIEEPHGLAHALMLAPHMIKPIGSSKCVHVHRLHALGREPVRPLPTHLLAKAGAGSLEVVIQRGLAPAAPSLRLLVGPGHGVVPTAGLQSSLANPTIIGMHGAEAPDVHGPQIHAGYALHDPLGKSLTGSPAGRDAKGVEASPHKVPR